MTATLYAVEEETGLVDPHLLRVGI